MEEAELWAASGAMALTGRADGPPLLSPGRPATFVRDQLEGVWRSAKDLSGRRPDLPSVELLAERAAIAGLTRNGPWSCGGAFRMVPTLDGHFGLSLARPDDFALIPALTEALSPGAPWDMLSEWAATVTSSAAGERAEMLGLPYATWPTPPAARPPVAVSTHGSRTPTEQPVVMDLTSLWAGPLCAHLLGLSGCRVVKVESTQRPDGARRGPAEFFDLLHAGHESVALDFTDSSDVDRLKELLHRADLVLEASRPRALQALGIDVGDYLASGTSWLSITARGRESNAVGFGDDIAVAAGLAVPDGGELLPVGDAIADPLSGVTAANIAAQALTWSDVSFIDISMIDVVRMVAGADDAPAVDIGGLQVAAPVARKPRGKAPELGQHNEAWL